MPAHRMLRLVFYATGLALAATSTAQNLASTALAHAADSDLFNDHPVWRLRLEVGAEELAQLRRNAREYVRATLQDEAQRYPAVGLHLKGATGSFRRLENKPSLTLSFDWLDTAQRFHGLRKIHLNNSVEDPSYLNELLGSELFRAANVPAARVSHASVELNGRRLGLYVLKEGFTEDFVARYFPAPGGRLYEPGPGHDVNQPLEQKLGPERRDRAGLDALSAAALEPDLQERWPRLQQTLDLERFLSFMAMEVMIGHRDGYSLAKNNFRVYDDAVTHRVVFLPHGMDQLFGESPPMIEPHMSGLVARALLATEPGREAYRRQFGLLFTNLYDSATLRRRVDAVSAKLRPALSSAEARPFLAAVAELKVRLAQRHAAVQKQLSQPELQLLPFVDGVARLPGWHPVDEPPEGVMREIHAPGGKTQLYVRAGPQTAASWRTTVRLPPGRYQFAGKVRALDVEPLPFGKRQGITLRVWRPHPVGSAPASFNTPGETLQVEFELNGEQEVELGCELRARAGEAWFDAQSLRLIRVSVR